MADELLMQVHHRLVRLGEKVQRLLRDLDQFCISGAASIRSSLVWKCLQKAVLLIPTSASTWSIPTLRNRSR